MNTIRLVFREIKIAFFNLFRNLRRTLLTLLSIIMGTVFLMLFAGYLNMVDIGFREGIINRELGHFQIYKKGYNNYDRPYSMKYSLTPEEVTEIEGILLEMDEVDFITPRIKINGIIGSSESSQIFVGYSGDAEYETMMGLNIVKGEGLNIVDYSKAVLGSGLMKKLNAKIGDVLTIMTQNEYGGLEASNITINGVSNFGSKDMNDIYIVTSIETARELLYTENTQKLIVMLKKTSMLDSVLNAFMEKAKSKNLDIEILTWEDLSDLYQSVMRMFKDYLGIAVIVILLVVVFSISNTIFMSVMERITEIGTLRAIGTSKIEILRIIIFEAIFIGLIGVVFSIILVNISIPILNNMDLRIPPPPGMTDSQPIMFLCDNLIYIKYSSITMLTTIIASIIPAIKGANINIIDAIRHS